ncbi:metal-dependent hydrolase [Paenibacillus sp. YAF4_2]|uniref:metal-dependent hydrolase n=1 Tax=Paenibacillus sp. YAF4_2 TaxID=3233085 RepID=UPI003F95971C
MDTGSHLLFGATLGGLACLNPTVSSQPEIGFAILAGTIIGSHAPDFDVFARLRGHAAYIRHHRGIMHSLPAPFLWARALVLPSAWLLGVMEHVLLIMLWTLGFVDQVHLHVHEHQNGFEVSWIDVRFWRDNHQMAFGVDVSKFRSGRVIQHGRFCCFFFLSHI